MADATQERDDRRDGGQDFAMQVAAFYANIYARQERLGKEFEAAIEANREALYET
jgi:hypothetical protein